MAGASELREPNAEIHSVEDLEQYFLSGCKEPASWKIGVEYEKPVVCAATGESRGYDGEDGIAALLGAMLKRFPWAGTYEGEHLIALYDGRASITLEPGGQLEMSGQQCDSLHCASEELDRHIDEILQVGSDLGLCFLGLGIVPKTPIERMPWMPKRRYEIMREVMSSTGQLGHRMMQQTATVQANFDYSDEMDALRKFRLAMAMSPVLIAVSANSPVADGKPTGYRSFRAHIWRDTDPARCGILPFAFETTELFAAYTQYALDVPLYFISRQGRLVPGRGKSFRRFLAEGLDGHHAMMADWGLHLTTLFPEARLKTYLEVRAADSQPAELMLATPALMKGLLYERDCIDAAWDVVGPWSLEERLELGEQAARHGLQARVRGHGLRDYARELILIAREGLSRQASRAGAEQDETVYLERLADEVEHGTCPADRIIAHWEGDWHGDVDRLIRYASYARRLETAAHPPPIA